jgi:hypothetical protein
MLNAILLVVMGLSSQPIPSYAMPAETSCDGYAELHYAMSGGRDAAYEDAIADCRNSPAGESDEGPDGSSPDVEYHTIPAGSTYPLWELVEAVGCGQPIASKRLSDGGMGYAFQCERLTGEAKAERDLEVAR